MYAAFIYIYHKPNVGRQKPVPWILWVLFIILYNDVRLIRYVPKQFDL